MTPSARAQAAIELLEILWLSPTPEGATAPFFRQRRYAGSTDRRTIIAAAFDCLRRRFRLDWWAARLGLEATPRSHVLLSGIFDNGAAFADLFAAGPYGPAPLADDERRALAALGGQPLEHPAMPEPVRLEYPAWLAPWLQEPARLAAFLAPAPVDVRVNETKANRQGVAAALGDAGIGCQPTPLSPTGLRLLGRAPLEQTPAFRDGLIEVQDEGSQLVALLCDARPGHTVVDFCAGAGGKTLALAVGMGRKGVIHACDANAARLKRMDARLARADPRIVRPLALPDDAWAKRTAGTADRVLLDVPCSGIGAWRRALGARQHLSLERLQEHLATQARLLDEASALVKPGGRLIYATCSVLAAENRGQIAAFLGRPGGAAFTPLAISDIWAATIAAPCPPTPDAYLDLAPDSTGTDGFFVAVLERG